ncbi:D-serine/D-alanine/glycine transporter [Serratia symbiotica]|nr:D-serine/D-alanine/glycine transporter [Serratia symbiotica]
MLKNSKINNNFISKKNLKRNLSNRHIQLMSIGGAIGTGLFMGSGKTINLTGPSIIIVYIIIGFILFFLMRAMGELLLSNLKYQSFNDFTSDLIGPWAGFFTGWTYWFCWLVTGIADIIAITSYTQFWFPNLSQCITSLIYITLLFCLNLITVKIFGETEFWFAIIKIIAIMSLIISGLIMIFMKFQSPLGIIASFSNLWNNGDFFPKGINGFFASFQIAIFSFVGIELVGTTAAETINPEKNLPRAINAIPLRIIMFYIFTLIIIMSVTPWNLIVTYKSPFVELFSIFGLPSSANIINFVVLTSAISSANSGIFSTSRMLFGLAKTGNAPKIFNNLSYQSIPINGLIFSCICLLSGTILIFLIPNIMIIFTLITTVSASLFIFIWSVILYSYLIYRKQYPILHKKSIYKMPAGKIMCWICIIFFIFIFILLTLYEDTQKALIITFLWFIILSLCYKFLNKKHLNYN